MKGEKIHQTDDWFIIFVFVSKLPFPCLWHFRIFFFSIVLAFWKPFECNRFMGQMIEHTHNSCSTSSSGINRLSLNRKWMESIVRFNWCMHTVKTGFGMFSSAYHTCAVQCRQEHQKKKWRLLNCICIEAKRWMIVANNTLDISSTAQEINKSDHITGPSTYRFGNNKLLMASERFKHKKQWWERKKQHLWHSFNWSPINLSGYHDIKWIAFQWWTSGTGTNKKKIIYKWISR